MRTVDQGIYGLMAVAWVAIGFTSYRGENVPWGGTGIWLVACAVPAGILVALLRHATEFALRMYLWTAAVIGFTRGFLYAVDWTGRGTTFIPMAVWGLLVATTLLAFAPRPCRTCRTE